MNDSCLISPILGTRILLGFVSIFKLVLDFPKKNTTLSLNPIFLCILFSMSVLFFQFWFTNFWCFICNFFHWIPKVRYTIFYAVLTGFRWATLGSTPRPKLNSPCFHIRIFRLENSGKPLIKALLLGSKCDYTSINVLGIADRCRSSIRIPPKTRINHAKNPVLE